MTRVITAVIALALVLPACKDDEPEESSSPSESTGPRRPGSSGTPTAGSREPGEPRGGSGGAGATAEPGKPGESGQELAPERGATEFVSADPRQEQGANRGGVLTPGAMAAAGTGAAPSPSTDAAEGAAGGAPRSVERGDIYKVLADGRILNLNSYRGLQVIDVRDVNAPRIEGRLAVTGTPVEMYVVGERAIVLLNGWQGYYGSRDDVAVESVQGGLVLNVDLSDRAKPVVLGQAIVDGSISTSRLTQGGGKAALYVAASVYKNEPPYTNTTLVESFDVSGNEVASKSELDLGGYVQDVQATTDLLLVSSIDYQMGAQRSTVSLIDISSPDGVMVKGGSITARGTVANKFNMDAYKGVLRVVSGSSWGGTQENHLETFSLADLARPRPLASCAFGATEMLYATIFIENKGFFVTYFRQDPFHTFSIDDQGRCEEHNQFIVSGWNDFLRPTLAGTRLIGVGRNDENNRSTVSVSLYDAVNLDNTRPLLARSDLALDQSYSEAQWDDRAFSVIEDAVSAQADNGTTETGLVLLPFEGYDPASQKYIAQVQVLTFSDRTLTRRGVMDHGSAVRRSFLAGASTAANLSEEELRLFDLANPNAPQARGKLEVAPNYRQVLVYGDYVARVHDSSFYWRWGGSNVSPPAAQVEILPRSGDLDSGAVVASFAVPSTATLTQVGNLLVSSLTQLDPDSGSFANPDTKYTTNIEVYDLSDPTKPQKRGTLETDRITPSYSFGPYPGGGPAGVAIDCFDCRRPGHSGTSQYVTGPAIVYVSTKQQQRSLGTVRSCYEYPVGSFCRMAPSGMGCEEYYSGQISCTTRKGQPEQCSGEFYTCNGTTGECKPVPDGTKVETQKSCSDYEEFRYWQSYGFDPLDLRDPGQPVLTPRVAMNEQEEGTSLLASGTGLYFNYQQPQIVTNDPRAYVKRYFRLVDFADPSKPSVGPGINIPGDVIANEGSTVFTRDFVWEDDDSRTMVARLEVQGDLAELKASRVFAQRQVSAVKPDGAGHVLVSSDPSYHGLPVATPLPGSSASPITPEDPPKHLLSILDAQSLEISGEAEVDQWATFTDAKAGRALFSVSGGLLVFNVEDAAKPVAQAYFPTVTFPNDIYFDGKEALFAAGPYGVYRFDTDVFNLLTK